MSLDLRNEASSRLVIIIDFVSSSTKKLSQRAYSVEEIGSTFEAYTDIQSQFGDTVKELESVTGLAKVLAAWTRERLEGTYKNVIDLLLRLYNYFNLITLFSQA